MDSNTGGDVGLIDVSAEDDSLICFGIGNQNDNDGDDDDDYFRLHEEAEAEAETIIKKPSGKCNLRKSLAWDSAFFTSAGVLEPEELSIINSGLNLPPIEEDIRKSADSSTSTLASDNVEDTAFTVFQDVRASIHRSTKPTTPAQSSTKMNSASRSKPIVACKRQTTIIQGFRRTKKEPETTKETEKTKRETGGNKKEAFHAQVTGRSGDLNTSSLRPPKIVGRHNSSLMSPTKRATLGASRVKTDTNTRKFAMGRKENVGGSKRPVIGDSNVTPRSTPSPRSSSSSSVSGTMLGSAASCSSLNRSGSTSSDSNEISPCNSSRKKTNCRNVNSALNIKPSLRISPIIKTEAHPSVHHLPVSKRSSSISPASSLDGWSSESSSSTSANQHLNNSIKVIKASSPRGELYSERGTFQPDMQKHHRNQLCVEQKKTGLPSPFSKVSMSGIGFLTRPAAIDTPRSAKPTGLRMPSPKFGYFDTEKAAEPTPTGFQFHPGVKSALPKQGAGVGNLHGFAVRAKAGKLQPARSMTGKNSINFDPLPRGAPHCVSSRKPTGESQELLKTSPCVSTTETTGQPLGFSNVSAKGTDPGAIEVIYPSIASIPQDGKMYGGSDLEVGELGSLLCGEDTGDHHSFLNGMDTTSEQASATEAIGECSNVSSELQKDRCRRVCVENYSKTEDVRESTNTEGDCININMNEGDGGQDSVVLDIGLSCEKVSATKMTKEHQGLTSEHNDLCNRTGSESPPRNEKLRQMTVTESNELSLKGDESCQGSLVNDIGILSGKLLHMSPIVGNTSKNQISYRSSADGHDINIASIEAGKTLLHDLGHLESNLHHFHDINEKENSFCFENQADGLGKHISFIDSMEELKDSSFLKFDGQTYSPGTKLSAINSREVLVHDQVGFPNVMLKAISHSRSTNSMEILARTPLAVKPSLCNETATSEFTSELTMEKVSTSSITDGGQKTD